jgi:transcriptional regulator with XRE-family HTH domain
MLRHFLRSRRAALAPETVGLPAVGRRGTPGLRREEVALLAGVSASWYTWLEQGRDIKVSAQVLDLVSGALRLNEAERAHLYRLTGTDPAAFAASAAPEQLVARLDRIVGGWLPFPAYVTDRYWNVLAANGTASSVVGVPEVGRNYLFAFFLDPGIRDRYPEWTETGRCLGAQFRAGAARCPTDQEFDRIACALSCASPLFDEIRQKHGICDRATITAGIRFPDGRVTPCEHTTLLLAGSADLRLTLLTPLGPARVESSRQSGVLTS